MIKKIDRSTLLFFAGALLVYLIVQVLYSAGILTTFWITIIRLGGVMAIVSLGLNLIYGFNGQFSLGQFAFYAIGAYAAADVTFRWKVNGSADGLIVLFLVTLLVAAVIIGLRRLLSRVHNLDALSAFALYLTATVIASVVAVVIGGFLTPAITGLFNLLPESLAMQIMYVLAVLAGGMLAAEISFLFGLPVLTLGSDYFGIATLGLTIIVKVLLDNSDKMLGFEEMKGARGMVGIPPNLTTWTWLFIFLLAVVIITRNLLHSSYGRAIVSVREDEIAAKAMGIDVGNYKTLTFVLGSFFAGIAGGLYAHINGFLHPNTFNFIKSFDPLIIIVFGGLGSVTGTLIASFTWALVLEGLLRELLPQGFETWRFVVYPLLLLLLMLLRPSGLLGEFELPFLRQALPRLRHTPPLTPAEGPAPGILTSSAEANQPSPPVNPSLGDSPARGKAAK